MQTPSRRAVAWDDRGAVALTGAGVGGLQGSGRGRPSTERTTAVFRRGGGRQHRRRSVPERGRRREAGAERRRSRRGTDALGSLTAEGLSGFRLGLSSFRLCVMEKGRGRRRRFIPPPFSPGWSHEPGLKGVFSPGWWFQPGLKGGS